MKYFKRAVKERRPFPLIITAPGSDYAIDGSLHYLVDDPSGEEILPEVEVPSINWDKMALVYRTHFLGQAHANYGLLDKKLGPLIVSLKFEPSQVDNQEQVRVLIRTTDGVFHKLAQISSLTARYIRPAKICELIFKRSFDSFVPISHPGVRAFDDHVNQTSFQCGVLYQKSHQISETYIYNNEDHSQDMEDFLCMLGDRIIMRKYSGNMRSRDPGVEAVFSKYECSEVLFHVATLLPYEENVCEQIERKTAVGKNRVCVIFQDIDGTPFMPSLMSSKHMRVFIIVRPIDATRYMVSVTAPEGLSSFPPELPVPAVFRKGEDLRQFLIAKIINAEIVCKKELPDDNEITQKEKWLEALQLLSAEVLSNSQMFTGTEMPRKGKLSAINNKIKKIVKIKKSADPFRKVEFCDPEEPEVNSGAEENGSSPVDEVAETECPAPEQSPLLEANYTEGSFEKEDSKKTKKGSFWSKGKPKYEKKKKKSRPDPELELNNDEESKFGEHIEINDDFSKGDCFSGPVTNSCEGSQPSTSVESSNGISKDESNIDQQAENSESSGHVEKGQKKKKKGTKLFCIPISFMKRKKTRKVAGENLHIPDKHEEVLINCGESPKPSWLSSVLRSVRSFCRSFRAHYYS